MTIYHKHHIVPRHAGGTDDPSNLVELTVEEHAEAHRKLYEQYGRWQDRIAWKALSGMIGKDEIIKEIQRQNGKKVGKAQAGTNLSEEHKKNISAAMTGKRHSEESRKKMSEAKKNMSEETRKKMSEAKKNISEETRKKISDSLSKEWIVIDPQGNEYQICNLNQFCKEHNLNAGNMYTVAKGKMSYYKGWSCSFI